MNSDRLADVCVSEAAIELVNGPATATETARAAVGACKAEWGNNQHIAPALAAVGDPWLNERALAWVVRYRAGHCRTPT